MSLSGDDPFDLEELLHGIRTWVEIESPSRDVARANRMADRIEADCRAAGLAVERFGNREGLGDHLLASTAGQGPHVLILSHYDTVHPAGTLESTLPFRVDGDLAYGPGIADMKAGAYMAHAALARLIRQPGGARAPVRHLIVSDEEIGSPSSRKLIEEQARGALYVLVTEPVREGGRCVTGRKGIAAFTLTVEGRASHAGLCHAEGRNAIREMARHVLALEEMTDYQAGLTVSVGTIHGGTERNVVPHRCAVEVDMRVPDMGVAERAIAQILALRPSSEDFRLEIAGGLRRPPYSKTGIVGQLHAHACALAQQCGAAAMRSRQCGRPAAASSSTLA
jgi:glutamate carboxypeptidase